MQPAEDFAQLKRLMERAQGRDVFLLSLRPGLRGTPTNLAPPPGSPPDCKTVFRVTREDLRVFLARRNAL